TRSNALTDENRWQKLDIFKLIKEGKPLFLLANLAIGAHHRRLGAELGVRPGAELLAAAEPADAVAAQLAPADREIQVTLKRTWANLGSWRKLTLVYAIMESLFYRRGDDEDSVDIEQLKEKAHLSEMMAEFARALP